jgi:sarcosine oxidase subunit gamma
MGPDVTVELARSPLSHRRYDLEDVARATSGGLAIIEVAFLAQIDVRVDEAVARAAALPVPFAPNTVLRHELRAALWLGPDEWLVTGPAGAQASLSAELEAALAGEHRSIVDVSANRAVLDLSGGLVRDVLASGCPIDLHPRAWEPGVCAQTLFDRTQVLLEQLAGETVRIYVRPSLADDLVDRLIARVS